MAVDSLQVWLEFENIEISFKKCGITATEAFQFFELQKLFEQIEGALTLADLQMLHSCPEFELNELEALSHSNGFQRWSMKDQTEIRFRIVIRFCKIKQRK